MLVLNLRPLWWWSYKQIHLWPSAAFFRDLECDREWVAECDGRQAGEHVSVLGLVPVGSKLIRSANEDHTIGHR
jgi:hypothetical protein